MKTTSVKFISCLLGITCLTIFWSGLTAQAETKDPVAPDVVASEPIQNGSSTTSVEVSDARSVASEQMALSEQQAESIPVFASHEAPIELTSVQTSASALLPEPSATLRATSETTVAQADSTAPTVAPPEVTTPTETTPSGTTPSVTTPEVTTPEVTTPSVPTPAGDTPSITVPSVTTPSVTVSPGRATRSGPSYIGVGGNFGVLGGSSLGNQSLSIFSKIGLLRFLSIRPGVTVDFDNDATILLPVTLDLVPRRPEGTGLNIAPYIGGGAAVTTDGDVGPLLSAGLDVPISRQFTATAGLNVGFLDPIDLGVFVGVGYNFGGLF